MARKRLTVTVPEELIAPIKIKAVQQNTNVSAVVEILLRLWLDSDKSAEELLAILRQAIESNND